VSEPFDLLRRAAAAFESVGETAAAVRVRALAVTIEKSLSYHARMRAFRQEKDAEAARRLAEGKTKAQIVAAANARINGITALLDRGMSTSEIAKELGLSYTRARQMVRRARERDTSK
jgi:DNA-binding NarL/FixJ family response regulator